jgi:hypothetical protein
MAPEPAPVPEPIRISGRVFVPIFVASLLIAVVAAVTLMLHLEPVQKAAREKTFPLQAKLGARCEVGGVSADLRADPHCPANSVLLLSATEPAADAKNVIYAIVGASPSEPVPAWKFVPGETVRAPLTGLVPGSHMLVFLVSNKPADPDEMSKAIAMAPPGDVPDRLVKIYQFANVLRHSEIDAHVESIEFRVEAAR